MPENDGVWDPIIEMSYHIKSFDEITLMKVIEELRL